MALNILISSLPLPTDKVGSWTNRIGEFQRRNHFFDHILSPTDHPDDTYIYCQKKELNTVQKLSGNRNEKIGVDYWKALLKLSNREKALKILVVDDRSLLETIAIGKKELPEGSELYYSHHGHSLPAPPQIFNQVDKVFFLTRLGYQKTLVNNYQFTPEVFIVGNGVVGDQFKSLSSEQKAARKQEMGWSADDKVITWLANSRPVKGLHLFKKVVQSIWEKHPDVKVVSMGHELQEDIESENWLQTGVIKNSDLPKYLQLGDAYFFTSLWQEGFGLSLAEAVKCGNTPITSASGGIPEVLAQISESIFIEEPNIVSEWVKAFDEFLVRNASSRAVSSQQDLAQWHSYENWEQKFKTALEA